MGAGEIWTILGRPFLFCLGSRFLLEGWIIIIFVLHLHFRSFRFAFFALTAGMIAMFPPWRGFAAINSRGSRTTTASSGRWARQNCLRTLALVESILQQRRANGQTNATSSQAWQLETKWTCSQQTLITEHRTVITNSDRKSPNSRLSLFVTAHRQKNPEHRYCAVVGWVSMVWCKLK